MQIRKARFSDLQAITAIYNQAIKHEYATGDTQERTLQQQRVWFEGHTNDQFPIFVACDGNCVVGFNYLSPYRYARPAFRHTLETSYYIHDDYQRQGIASQLMNHVMEYAISHQVRNLIAYVMERNKASVRFLEKYNFDLWGRLPGVVEHGDNVSDHLIFGRRLIEQ